MALSVGKGQGPHLPAKGMQPHHSPVMRAERPHRVCQDLLQGEQDLLIKAAHQVPVGPTGAALGQRGERGTGPPNWTQVRAHRENGGAWHTEVSKQGGLLFRD